MQIIKQGQKAILFSAVKNGSFKSLNESLEELKDLCLATGLKPVCLIKQSLKNISPGILIGKGKLQELEHKVSAFKPHYVIFDHDLSGVQTRNLEKLLKIHVLDRCQLILEIFAGRAKTFEGKLQVELACLMDQMPRMVGAWLGSLSRQGGGASAKGPGEKALETDRRQAQYRIQKVRAKLEKVKKHRARQRSTRIKNNIPSFALIGYTNSGKSSLLNVLTKSSVEVKDQVFMTLDPTTRRVFIPGTDKAVLTDTVGFIRNLPPHLISAFKATLEESAGADILLHVVDISNLLWQKHIRVVQGLVKEFAWDKKPVIYVFNKTDLLPGKSNTLPPPGFKNAVCVSAKTCDNIKSLLQKMKKSVESLNITAELFIPKTSLYKVHYLNQQAEILKKQIGSRGLVCRGKNTIQQNQPVETVSCILVIA